MLAQPALPASQLIVLGPCLTAPGMSRSAGWPRGCGAGAGLGGAGVLARPPPGPQPALGPRRARAGGGCPPAGVEAFGVAVHPRIAVERVRAEHDHAARREPVPAEFDIDGRPPGQYPYRVVQAQRLGDHGAGERRPGQSVVVGVLTGEHQVGLLLHAFLDLGW